MENKDVLLSVKDYKVSFKTRTSTVYAVNGISFDLKQGETLGIVGESGSGKTVSCMSMLKLIPMPPGNIDSGSVRFNGTDLVPFSEKELRPYRGKEISIIFQDPMTAFNPVMPIGEQLIEGYMHHFHATRKEARDRAIKFLELVGIPSPATRLKDYPNQYSGGMRQRAMIAMALICEPKLVIADEPTTALDVTIQAQIVDLVKKLRDELGTSIIWISHDLGVVASLADRVNVMYAGFIVESAKSDALYEKAMHPYTIGLLESLPAIDGEGTNRLTSIPGIPPYLSEPPVGCPFAPRCKQAKEKCTQSLPMLHEVEKGHFVACHDIGKGANSDEIN